MTKKAYLGIGSNLGDKKHNLDSAIASLGELPGIDVIKVSSYYETEPIDYTDQDWFINCVIEIETILEPRDLLSACQAIENELKRVRMIRYGPRTIDIDLLLYEGYDADDPDLTIPHPRMTKRGFVLIPLYEIAGNLKIGSLTIEDYLKVLENQQVSMVIKQEGMNL